jgi:hypothetical protein
MPKILITANISPKTGEEVCDFCNNPIGRQQTIATFQIKPGEELATGIVDGMETFVSDSDGLWAACDQCAELVRLNAMEPLLKRSVETFIASLSAGDLSRAVSNSGSIRRFRQQLTAQVRSVHAAFWMNLQGEKKA